MWPSDKSNVRYTCTGFEQLCPLRNWRYVVLTTKLWRLPTSEMWYQEILYVPVDKPPCHHRTRQSSLVNSITMHLKWEIFLCSGVYIIHWYIRLALSAYEKASPFFSVLYHTSLPTAHYFPAWTVLFPSYDMSIYFFISPFFLYAIYLLLVFIGILLLM